MGSLRVRERSKLVVIHSYQPPKDSCLYWNKNCGVRNRIKDVKRPDQMGLAAASLSRNAMKSCVNKLYVATCNWAQLGVAVNGFT